MSTFNSTGAGRWRALSWLGIGDEYGTRRNIPPEDTFEASATELRGLVEGRDYQLAELPVTDLQRNGTYGSTRSTLREWEKT